MGKTEMQVTRKRIYLGCLVVWLMAGLVGVPGMSQQKSRKAGGVPKRRAAASSSAKNEHEAHQQHTPSQHRMVVTAGHPEAPTLDEFKIVRIFRAPENFNGNVTYDRETNRLWLLSIGPPANTKGPSMLYELDPANGKVLGQTRMPFLGEFGAPVYVDGFLYVGIPFESKLYKVSVARETLGQIVKTIDLPKLAELKLTDDEPYRFPFLNFAGLALAADKNILLPADDVGMLITVDRETGQILKQVRTLKGLAGATAVPGPNQEWFVIGNTDPESTLLKADSRKFMFRAAHGFTPPYAIRTEVPCQRYGARDINWALLDSGTGEVLASMLQQCSRAAAGSVALMKYEKLARTRYGRYTFLATGDEGILTVEWTPK